MEEEASDGDRALWRDLVEAEGNFLAARHSFVRAAANPVAILRDALHRPSERGIALRLLRSLPTKDSLGLFDDLVELASVGHADISLARELIVRMPRDWVLSNIEATAQPLLLGATDEEYRRLLELYILLDPNLTMQLASRAAASQDEDIREAGADFLDRLRE